MRLERRRSREGVKTLCAGRKISVRMERNFCAHENLFPCAQKNIFVRTEISWLPQGDFLASACALVYGQARPWRRSPASPL